MEENTNKAIFTLMQKVVDKLDAISKDVNKKDQTELVDIVKKTNVAITALVTDMFNSQTKLLQTSSDISDEVSSCLKENKITPTVNNYTEYSLLGSKSHFKPWVIGVFIFSLVTVWCSIKYLPSYYMEKNSISKAKEDYQIFYNLVYIKEFEKNKNTSANEVLKKIKQKDPIFMEEYKTLFSTHQREIKKQELKEALKLLDNNDR